MKILIIFSALFFISGISLNAQSDTLIDTRDGKVYKSIQIGQQTWMAENLDFKTEKSYCYLNKAVNCETYGRLYRWEAASQACPEGWHLPTDEEWQTLEKELGMTEIELAKENNWRGSDQATKLMTDSTIGFIMLLGGYRNPPSNYFLNGMQAFFWSASDRGTHAWYRQMRDGSGQIFRRTQPKSWAMSVRCIKNKE
ncbi:MAG: fibrobacter succinogenes major paralogous domain-containing protein [Bacteroidota bacterium]